MKGTAGSRYLQITKKPIASAAQTSMPAAGTRAYFFRLQNETAMADAKPKGMSTA